MAAAPAGRGKPPGAPPLGPPRWHGRAMAPAIAGRGKPPGPPPPGPPGLPGRRGESEGKAFTGVSCASICYPELDSRFPCRIMIDNQEWSSIDKFCQADAVPSSACLGSSLKQLENIYVATHAKFDQNDHYRDVLLSTCGPFAPTGHTSDWHHVTLWQHWHGRVLQRLREEFRPAEERDECLLQSFQQEFAVMGFDEALVFERVESIARDFKLLRQPRHLIGITMDGSQLEFDDLTSLARIIDLRRQCADRLETTLSQVQLLFGEETLVDTKTIGDVAISDGEHFTIIVDSLSGPCRWKVDTLGGVPTAGTRNNLLADIERYRRD